MSYRNREPPPEAKLDMVDGVRQVHWYGTEFQLSSRKTS